MKMHNPPHPGDILKQDVLPELDITIAAAATALGVSRVTLSRVVNGRAAISADMALRLGTWLGNGAEVWLRMQAAYDLWQARQRPQPRIKPVRHAA